MLRSTIVLAALAAAPGFAAEIPRHAAPVVSLPRHDNLRSPGIRIWTSGSDLHRRNDRVRMFYRTERDAYVTIFRVDTDGRVQLLFPRSPEEENYGYGGATYSVASYDRSTAFLVDDYPGVGYLFGVASTEPFNFEAVSANGHWDLRNVYDGRLHGDPRASLEEMATQMMASGYSDFDTHILPYYVEQRYDYPRFVCYDCHSYSPWVSWNPYRSWCRSYTLVVFNDPYYYYPSYWYPSYYGGRRVVYTRGRDTRYVFKTRDGSAPGIDYRDRRSTASASGATSRVPADRGIRGTDIGGVGSIPTPRTDGRRLAPPSGSGSEGGVSGERPGGRDRAPDNPSDPTNAGGRRGDEPQQPGQAPTDPGRRRADRPGIEIVPAPDQQPILIDGRRPAAPATGTTPDRSTTRAPEADRPARPDASRRQPDDGYRTPTPERPGDAPGYGDEPRPPRPTGAPRPDTYVAPRQPATQPRTDPQRTPSRAEAPQSEKPREQPREARPAQPENRPQPSERPRESSPPQREASPPRESRPQASPPPSPPRESRPQASPPPSPPRESRPQQSAPPRSDGGSARRRP